MVLERLVVEDAGLGVKCWLSRYPFGAFKLAAVRGSAVGFNQEMRAARHMCSVCSNLPFTISPRVSSRVIWTLYFCLAIHEFQGKWTLSSASQRTGYGRCTITDEMLFRCLFQQSKLTGLDQNHWPQTHFILTCQTRHTYSRNCSR